MRKTSTAIALVMAASAGPAIAAAQWSFADIDQDGNLELTEREFERVSRDMFGQIDADQNQELSQQEFAAGSDLFLTQGDVEFAEWDADASDDVDMGEFHDQLFATYDRDQDESIGEQEFAQLGQATATERAALGMPGAGQQAIQADQIIPLPEWRYDELYAGGRSVEELIDEMEVYGAAGDEIGDVEDLIFGTKGEVLALIAEVGGFLDIGDTHVSIPWEEVDLQAYADAIAVPITEENVGEYSLFEADYLTAEEAGTEVVGGIDEAVTGPRAWRATELIGDYARLRQQDGFQNYGYVNDLIIRDGQLEAVLVEPDVAWGAGGPYAYPYYGWDAGWRPGTAYYDLPYTREEVAELETFEQDRLEQ